jgi:DUF438 domain-containing protein
MYHLCLGDLELSEQKVTNMRREINQLLDTTTQQPLDSTSTVQQNKENGELRSKLYSANQQIMNLEFKLKTLMQGEDDESNPKSDDGQLTPDIASKYKELKRLYL